MKSFITIKEACLLTHKSAITIRRLIRHVLKHDQANAGQMIRQEKTSSGFVYTLDKELLAQKHLLLPVPPGTQPPGHDQPLTSQMSTPLPSSAYADDQPADQAESHRPAETRAQPGDQPASQSPTHLRSQNPSSAYAPDQPLVKALVDTIDVLKDQLGAKDHQLAVKDEQISALIKDRERSDVLLKNLQDGIYLLQRPEPAHTPRPYTHEPEPESRGESAPQEAELLTEDKAVVQAEEASSTSQATDRGQTAKRPASKKTPRESDKLPAKEPTKAGQGIGPREQAAKPRPSPWWRPW